MNGTPETPRSIDASANNKYQTPEIRNREGSEDPDSESQWRRYNLLIEGATASGQVSFDDLAVFVSFLSEWSNLSSQPSPREYLRLRMAETECPQILGFYSRIDAIGRRVSW